MTLLILITRTQSCLGLGSGSGWHNCENFYQLRKVQKEKKCTVTREISSQMSFHQLSDFELGVNFRAGELKILDLMENHQLNEFITENFLDDLINSHDMKHCHYIDEDEFDKLNRPSTSYLKIFSMDIRSLPKHGESRVDRNWHAKYWYSETPIWKLWISFRAFFKTLYGGVGIYFSKNLHSLEILDIAIERSCHCTKCDIESLSATFCYGGEIYTICGIYRHPNGNTIHFVEDLEIALNKIGHNSTTILTGDINTDIIKFENDETCNYLSTLPSYRYLPYMTLLTRISTFSAICIDHIFYQLETIRL